MRNSLKLWIIFQSSSSRHLTQIITHLHKLFLFHGKYFCKLKGPSTRGKYNNFNAKTSEQIRWLPLPLNKIKKGRLPRQWPEAVHKCKLRFSNWTLVAKLKNEITHCYCYFQYNNNKIIWFSYGFRCNALWTQLKKIFLSNETLLFLFVYTVHTYLKLEFSKSFISIETWQWHIRSKRSAPLGNDIKKRQSILILYSANIQNFKCP